MEDLETRQLLTQYIQSGGKLGDVPDWYPTLNAAIYLGVAPWELVPDEGSHFIWIERAQMAMDAEGDAQIIMQDRARQAAARRYGKATADPAGMASEIRSELTKIARRDGGPHRLFQ